jgi:hypothetical protein
MGGCLCLVALAQQAIGTGQYLKVEYPASTAASELQLAVTYTIWIPEGAQTICGVIAHQHGADRPPLGHWHPPCLQLPTSSTPSP